MKVFIKKAVGLLIVIASIAFILWTFVYLDSLVCASIGTITLIIGATIMNTASDKDYNNTVTKIRRISDTNGVTFEKLFNDYKDLETPLGKPWIGRAAWNVSRSMVYGPTEDNDLVYVYMRGHKCYVSGIGMENLHINSPEVQAHKVTLKESELSKNDLACFHLMNNMSVHQVYESLVEYFKTGKATWNSEKSWKDAKAYAFTEQFKLIGQDFSMQDMDGNVVYRVSGKWPLKKLYFYDAKTSQEVFMVEKRILHILPHYDFYDHGKLIGTFEQKADITRDDFVLETEMGKFEVRQNLDDAGFGNTVYLKGKMIGAIATRLNLSLHNLVFNNYVLWSTDDQYTLILAAFTVMLARELQRDRDGIA